MSKELETVDAQTAMLRQLDSPIAGPTAEPENWFTPEFVSMVGTVVVNLLTAATIVGWVDANSAREISGALTGMIAAVGALTVNGLVVWKFLASRSGVKSAAVTARYQYMASVESNRMMAAMEQQRIMMMTRPPVARRRG